MYFRVTDQFRPTEHESVEDQIVKFEEDIGMRVSRKDIAQALLRDSMIARGIDPDATPDVQIEERWRQGPDDGFAEWEDADIQIEM